MRATARFSTIAGVFARDRRGNFAVMAAAIMSVILLAAGFALNVGQLIMTRSNLLNALDSAVTSTARDITTGRIAEKDVRKSVEAFLHANGAAGYAEAGRVALDNLVVDRKASTVRATATVDVDLAFPLFGPSSMRRVSVESAAVYSDKKIEVVMMLDVTGSMSGGKLRDLKEAAATAVDTLLGSNSAANPRVRVAIVPYADAVNTGPLANVVHLETGFTTGEPPRLGDPLLAGFKGFDACATERKGALQFSDASPREGMVNRDIRLSYCPSAALHPLTTDADGLKRTIGTFRAKGYTAGHIGVQWSWYMLSPRWATVLPEASRPAAHNKSAVSKYAILMTDGEFNTAFAGVAEHERTAGGQPTLSRNNAERLCDAMRDDGIEIFTIGFMLNEPRAKAVMQDCASPDRSSAQHYFETHSGAELEQAFLEIARNIERLALTK